MARARLFGWSFLILAPTLGAQVDPDYTLTLTHEVIPAGQPVDVKMFVGTTAKPIVGFSLGICSDEAYVDPVDIRTGKALAAMNDGDGPDFFTADLDPVGGSGLTCGTVFALLGGEFLEPGPAQEAVIMTYATVAGSEAVTPLEFCVIGVPTVLVSIGHIGGDAVPTQVNGAITLTSGAGAFIRGDANASGTLSIADPLWTLNYLFLDGPALCLAAMDGNGSGGINILDAIHSLLYINALGPPPPPPFPECGPVDPLGCAESACP